MNNHVTPLEKDVKGLKIPEVSGLFVARLMPLVLLVIGCVLTFSAFSASRLFVENINEVENDKITRVAINTVMDGLSDAVNSAQTLAALAAFSDDPEQWSEGKARDILQRFDHVVLLKLKDDGSQWRLVTLQKPEGGQGLVLGQDLLQAVAGASLWRGHDFRVLNEAKYFVSLGAASANAQEEMDYKANPFALVTLVNSRDYRQGILLAVTDFGEILRNRWTENPAQLTRISVRDIRADLSLFHRVFSTARHDKDAQYLAQRHEFRFGNQQWEISTQFSKGKQVFLFNLMPYFTLGLGSLFTVFGVLYLQGHYRQSLKRLKMARALEDKNAELEGEIEMREHLNILARKADRENRAIIDSVSDMIFETDAAGKLLFVNATWERITGFTQAQLLGMVLFDLLHQEDQAQQRQDFASLVQGQKAAYRAFVRMRIAEGSFRAMELSISMLRRDENNVLRVVGTITDVEERRRAERALAETEKKYRKIVERAAAGIYQLTPEGAYLSANPAMVRILGYASSEELVQEVKNAHREIYADPREHQAFIQKLRTEGSVKGREARIINRQGEVVWVSESARIVRDDAGNVLYYEGSLEDITARKESDHLLREAKVLSDMANRAKSEFLANMSHELRTPLNAIIGFSEMIKNEIFGPVGQDSYKEYAADIYQSGQNLLRIINEILDISKIEAGKRNLQESAVDMGAVATTCLGLLDDKIKEENLRVSNTIKDVPEVVAEKLALKQIMMNLLSNAVKYTPAGGRITLNAALDQDGAMRVSITDTGVGMEAEDVEKALSPFGQIEGADHARDSSGVGLGLTLVKALVGLHGGHFELISEKGIGTTATFVLPADRVRRRAEEKVS